MLPGCLSQDGRLRGPGGVDAGSSLEALINGMDDSDVKRPGVNFWLVCDSGQRLKGQPNTTVSSVRFDGNVADGDSCAMEVRMSDTDAPKDWEWYGVKRDRSTDIGLLYGSSKGQVKNHGLALTLYKLYAVKDNATFTVNLAVTLDGQTGAAMPDISAASASLVCGPTTKYPGHLIKEGGERDLRLTFDTVVAYDMRHAACTHVAILTTQGAATSAVAFEGDLTDVKFIVPKKGETQNFPATGRYTLKAAVLSTGGAVTPTITEGQCLTLSPDGQCSDRRSVDLPSAPNYLLARVTGKYANGKGNVVSFYAGVASGAGTQGLGLFAANKLAVDDLNRSLKGQTSANEPHYSWYPDQLGATLLATDFTDDAVAGKSFTGQQAQPEELKDLLILNIDKVWVHGFHQVDLAELNARKSARWIAAVHAQRTGATSLDFYVTGSTKYFYSPTAPIRISDTASSYIDFSTLVQEMGQAGGPVHWRVYAAKGSPLVDAGCQTDATYFLDGARLKTATALLATSTLDQKLDTCEVRGDHFTANLDASWQVTYAPSVWEWYLIAQ